MTASGIGENYKWWKYYKHLTKHKCTCMLYNCWYSSRIKNVYVRRYLIGIIFLCKLCVCMHIIFQMLRGQNIGAWKFEILPKLIWFFGFFFIMFVCTYQRGQTGGRALGLFRKIKFPQNLDFYSNFCGKLAGINIFFS